MVWGLGGRLRKSAAIIGPKWFTQRRTVGNRDAALRQQIFDVAKAQREPEIEPDRLPDNLRGEPVTVLGAPLARKLGNIRQLISAQSCAGAAYAAGDPCMWTISKDPAIRRSFRKFPQFDKVPLLIVWHQGLSASDAVMSTQLYSSTARVYP